MPGLLPDIDPDGLLEYSVVFTDRSLNHMSRTFQGVMNDISATLKNVYNAQAVVVVPGGGTYGMESVARQFATGRKCLVIRNGWFSFRWSQILEMGGIASEITVMKARAVEAGPQAALAPAPIGDVVERIKAEKPDMVFAPHVETASGMLLPDDYVRAVADAAHSVGGLFVLVTLFLPRGIAGLIQMIEGLSALPISKRLETLLSELDSEGWEVRDDLGRPVPGGAYLDAHVHPPVLGGCYPADGRRLLRRW